MADVRSLHPSTPPLTFFTGKRPQRPRQQSFRGQRLRQGHRALYSRRSHRPLQSRLILQPECRKRWQEVVERGTRRRRKGRSTHFRSVGTIY